MMGTDLVTPLKLKGLPAPQDLRLEALALLASCWGQIGSEAGGQALEQDLLGWVHVGPGWRSSK